MQINWIGLWTMVRREIQRLARVPIQAVVAPLISALLMWPVLALISASVRPHASPIVM